jgi:uncharacterized protein
MTSRVFLTGDWRYLAMLNYRVDPALLEPFVPQGTTLDHWQNATYVSLVGFLFHDTRVLGIPVPLHRDFEEVNLRFYVRRAVDGEIRRGVTFIREIVPRRAIATVARITYNEPHAALPMRHTIVAQLTPDDAQGDLAALYGATLGAVLQRPPDSAFLAEGSAIAVHAPTRLPR